MSDKKTVQFIEGMDANIHHKRIQECPYARGSEDYIEWCAGWNESDDEPSNLVDSEGWNWEPRPIFTQSEKVIIFGALGNHMTQNPNQTEEITKILAKIRNITEDDAPITSLG